LNGGTAQEDATAAIALLRPKLIRMAYRMLGSVMDAEDVVQEALIRWVNTATGEIREPEAFLRRIVTRLCLDQLKSSRRTRESYIGPWLPEPVVEEGEVEDVTLPLLLLLERLSPLERAAFLLHDVFGLDFEEVAAAMDRDAATCRQLAHRARHHVHSEKPRFKANKADGLALAHAFFAASRSGDIMALRQLLLADVTLQADGGGKRPAASKPVIGIESVSALVQGLAKVLRSTLIRMGFVNGLPGFVTREADGELQTTALDVQNGKISAIYVVRNPDKLRHLAH
jgi:RNA polymerase sigma-70 factor (ECF subfamily)